MKKLLALFTAMVLTASVFAVDLTLGARGSLNLSLGTTCEIYEDGADIKTFGVGAGGGVYANIGIINTPVKLGIQPEVNINYNYLYSYDNTLTMPLVGTWVVSQKVSMVTMDIPLLVTLDMPINDMFELGFGIGPQISFPFGVKYDASSTVSGNTSSSSDTYNSRPNFGMAFDVNGKFKLGKAKKFAIVADLRYNLDFTKTAATANNTTTEIATRRGLNIGVGCEYSF
ncbi:MAG: outer membrane beta-barrel protein [Treponema sp.]|nr:outer membrane beta-barrel protein [Treponema sp.]